MAAKDARGDSSNNGCVRTLLYIFNGFCWFGGLCCIGVGLWMKSDPYVVAYFNVLRRSVSDNALNAVSILLLVVGLIIIGIGFLGCCGVRRRNKPMLGGFLAGLILIMIMELCVGFVTVVFKEDIHRDLKTGMRETIKKDYEWENRMGRSWNFIQVRKKCCGVDGSWDYRQSNWWYGQNPGVEDENAADIFVPITCCVLNFNQDRDVSRVNPQDPQPQDEQRCQDDAKGRKDGSPNLHGRGCYATLLGFIYYHLNTLIGLGLAVGFLQFVGLVLGCYLWTVVDKGL